MTTMETTHVCDEHGNLVQVVSADELRLVLDAQGGSYDRPSEFGPDDEWNV